MSFTNLHRATASLLLTSTLLLAAGRASAQDAAGTDEITLKDGGTIRGTVVSAEPGTSVKIIELGQKEARVVPWSQVTDVERGKYTPKPAAQPGPAGAGYGMPAPQAVRPPEPQLGDRGVVRLRVTSPVPVAVMEQQPVHGYGGGFTIYRTACSSPCDKVMDVRRGQAFVASGEFPDSDPFVLNGLKGDVNLTVDPGSATRRSAGTVIGILGGTSLAFGAVALSMGLVSDSGTSGFDAPWATTPGAVMLAAGTVALIGGIVLVATSGTKTRLEQTAGPKTASAPRVWRGEF